MNNVVLIYLTVAYILWHTSVLPVARCVRKASLKADAISVAGFRNGVANDSVSHDSRKQHIYPLHKSSPVRTLAMISGANKDLDMIDKKASGQEDPGYNYFFELMSRNVPDIKKHHFDSYEKKCEYVKWELIKRFPNVISAYMSLLSQNVGNKRSSTDTHKHEELKPWTHTKGNVLDDAIIGVLKHYMEITKEGIDGKRGWFASRSKGALDADDQRVRLEQMIQLILKLEPYMYKTFRDRVASYKSHCLSNIFNREQFIINITDTSYPGKLQREFSTNAKKIIPGFFKISGEPKTLTQEILRFLANSEDPSLKESLAGFKGLPANEDSIKELSSQMKKWTVSADIEDFSTTVTAFHNGAKFIVKRHLKDDEKQEKLLQVLAAQQQQIQAYQKQLGLKSQSNVPLSCGFSYRMPNTNINVIGSIQRGKGNLQISCVPDESARLLGPYGFTSGVLPGNLGLSVNIDI